MKKRFRIQTRKQIISLKLKAHFLDRDNLLGGVQSSDPSDANDFLSIKDWELSAS
jgi:hypothetical protein